MANTYRLVQWSDFARNQRKYIQGLMKGQKFLLTRNGEVIATVEPTRPEATYRIEAGHHYTIG